VTVTVFDIRIARAVRAVRGCTMPSEGGVMRSLACGSGVALLRV
jgi:hypothetical protein